MRLQEREVLPPVTEAWEYCARPLCRCGVLVGFYAAAVFRFEVRAKDRVGEADGYADVVGAKEGVVAASSSASTKA